MNRSVKTYAEFYDLCHTVRRNTRRKYKNGVERAAALAAIETRGWEAAIDAIEGVFRAFRDYTNPQWDGSIA